MRINFTKISTVRLLFMSVFFLCSGTFAQRALPTLTEIVSAINGDTTSTGTRNNNSYTLSRGGVYFALGSIKSNYDLTITAVGNESLDDPKIIVVTDASGNYSTPFIPFKNLTLNGISLSGVNSAGKQISYLIEAGTTNIKITAKNCEIDSVVTAAIRVNYNSCSVFVENCYVHNIAGGSHTGRFIDARRTLMDSISIINSTFYNVMHNVVGRFEGGQKYFKFDHNTVYNLMRCPLRIDECPEIIVTNNLFLQTGFVGYIKYWETAFQSANEEAMGSRDEFARIEIWELGSSTAFTGMTQKINFKNNNFWEDPTIKTTWPDTIYSYKTLDFDFEKALVGADTLTWLKENCDFTSAPACDYASMCLTAWADGSTNTNPGFDNSKAPYSFSYSTSSNSYTAAEGGLPLGDLNWFPAKKAEWELMTDVEQNVNIVPSNFELKQNYPNPFNPVTIIRYSIPEVSDVQLKVYDVLGKEVALLVNSRQHAGEYNVSFNAQNVASGVYFYTITTGKYTNTHKMILMK